MLFNSIILRQVLVASAETTALPVCRASPERWVLGDSPVPAASPVWLARPGYQGRREAWGQRGTRGPLVHRAQPGCRATKGPLARRVQLVLSVPRARRDRGENPDCPDYQGRTALLETRVILERPERKGPRDLLDTQ